ncbi:MBL fold metallo-hydrolase [Sphingomonas aerophila]|uniref:L-ascorbate metabolism protein UlaG (Beta-lactamase superfamily) n=1 Tax=Sphingomonas aerophila TaxID=1344948 RepID=A0A7W9BGS1_9SPHN|nr:MBL fold metallo-hydrolase [Sphingomonas aerophila]MBB5716654.1 L-ascorbate metabolism protein UlaG (beta-lactamase superfamily) [Sphingomonas aerophila]
MPRNPHYAGPSSDHFDGTRFFNPGEPSTDRSLGQVLRWKMADAAAKWPTGAPVTPARPAARVDALTVTMVGHASLLIQVAGLNLLTDPVWSDRASPLSFAGPKRVTAPGVAFENLPPIDAVLLSHNHYDHMDVATLRRLQASFAPLFAMPLGNDAIVRAAVPGARIVVGDWHDRLDLGGNCSSTLTPANHWSARGARDRRMALWSGHWIHTPVASIWFVGDTGYGTGKIFHDLRARHGSPDLALIPIGAYEPRWFMGDQHVDPAAAVRIMQDLGAAHALGIHWGTFQLTDEPREAPVDELATALADADIAPDRFVAAEAGATYRF